MAMAFGFLLSFLKLKPFAECHLAFFPRGRHNQAPYSQWLKLQTFVASALEARSLDCCAHRAGFSEGCEGRVWYRLVSLILGEHLLPWFTHTVFIAGSLSPDFCKDLSLPFL